VSLTEPADESSPPRGPTPARAIALRVLLRVERGEFAASALDQALSAAALAERDRALVTALVDGTLRWRGRLDYALTHYLRRGLDSLTPAIRAILRLGAYQILLMDAIPARAACDEAVRMARTRGHRGTAALVNAVLRRLAEGGEPPLPDPDANEAAYISVAHSHPRWLVERWIANYGRSVTEAICEADNRPAPVCLRPNRLRATAEELTSLLAVEGMSVAPSPIAAGALRLLSGGHPARAAAHGRGLFTVQGDASIVVGLVAQPPPGARGLDMCAGVGGKATHMAELMDNRGHLLALDRQGARLARLNQECARLGITIIETREADARALRDDGYDLCLVDAPCSGTGALRRRVDSRWRKAAGQIPQLAALQRELLEKARTLVRPGGVIVYSVCSLEPEEREEVVSAVTARGGLHIEDSRGMMPHLHDTDGMFIVRLRRES